MEKQLVSLGKLLLAVLIQVTLVSNSKAHERPGAPYTELEIQYHTLISNGLPDTLERLRSNAVLTVESKNEEYISRFVAYFGISDLEHPVSVPLATDTPISADIVLVLRRRDGSAETFFSDGEYLYSVSSDKCGPLPDDLKYLYDLGEQHRIQVLSWPRGELGVELRKMREQLPTCLIPGKYR